jgi:two-component system response regulator RegA
LSPSRRALLILRLVDKPRTYLVLDDDPDVLTAAAMALSAQPARVLSATRPYDIDLKPGAFDAVLLDMNFEPGERSGVAGLSWLDHVRAADPALSVVVMTTFGGVSLAVETMKRGAVDFVLKPWRNSALIDSMQRAAELTAERRAGAALTLEDLERRAVERALALCDGNVSRAAQVLGLTRPALYRRMERHGL